MSSGCAPSTRQDLENLATPLNLLSLSADLVRKYILLVYLLPFFLFPFPVTEIFVILDDFYMSDSQAIHRWRGSSEHDHQEGPGYNFRHQVRR